jgi:DNA-binding NarL/FixJ family response regulator
MMDLERRPMQHMTDLHPPQKSFSVLVADSDPNVRAALRLLLARQPRFRVVAESQNAGELFHDSATLQPDLILLDWGLRGLDAPGHLRDLSRLSAEATIIALSTHDEVRQAALDLGATAFVSKSESPLQLLQVLHNLAEPGDMARSTSH